MKEKFLPIGSVCRLKGATKNVMITGFCVVKNDGSDQTVYDYLGCMYPQGIFSSEYNFMFNHEEIEEILHEGFVNDEEREFKMGLNSALDEMKKHQEGNNA